MLTAALSVFSAIVAGLAVYASWRSSRQQVEAAHRLATMQLVAPMRQAWINQLRKLLAELLGSASHYWAAGFDVRKDSEYLRIEILSDEIFLMLNPNEAEHQELAAMMKQMMNGLGEGGKAGDDKFWLAHKRAKELARSILKTEWNRTKAGT